MNWRNKWQENVYVIRYYPIRCYRWLKPILLQRDYTR